MISILQQNTDTVIKKYDHVKFLKADTLLEKYVKFVGNCSLRQLVLIERNYVLEARRIIHTDYVMTDFDPDYTPAMLFTKMANDEQLVVLFKHILLSSYWRDTKAFSDFELYPTQLEPFRWLEPMFQIKYSDSIEEMRSVRIDHTAYYFMKYIIGWRVKWLEETGLMI